MIRHAKRLIIFVLGISVVLVGVAMILLPGPAFIVIPAGLAILATEFVWARHLLKKMKEQAMSLGANCGLPVSKRAAVDPPDDSTGCGTGVPPVR